MTTTKTAPGSASIFTIPSVREATQNIQDLGEHWNESSKSAGLVGVDAFEQAVTTMADLDKKIAARSDVEWVSTLAATHAQMLTALAGSYTTGVRDLLK